MEVKIGKNGGRKYHGLVSKTKLNVLIGKHLKGAGIDSKTLKSLKKSTFIDTLWNELEGGQKKERKQTVMTPARKAHIEKMKKRGQLIAKIMKEEGKTLGEASKLVQTYKSKDGKKASKKKSKK